MNTTTIYKIIHKFECYGNKMLVVRMDGAACVMSESEYNRIIVNERKHEQRKKRRVA